MDKRSLQERIAILDDAYGGLPADYSVAEIEFLWDMLVAVEYDLEEC